MSSGTLEEKLLSEKVRINFNLYYVITFLFVCEDSHILSVLVNCRDFTALLSLCFKSRSNFLYLCRKLNLSDMC